MIIKPIKPRPEILLHPNIPKPLHGIAPRTIKGQDWWFEQKRIVLRKAQNRCMACGVHSSKAKFSSLLEVHECYTMDYKNARMIYIEAIALCHSCHMYIHSGLLEILLEKGTITPKEYDGIIKHGDRILKKAKLKHPMPPEDKTHWKQWRLVLEGVEYKGKFKDFEAWYDYYNK